MDAWLGGGRGRGGSHGGLRCKAQNSGCRSAGGWSEGLRHGGDLLPVLVGRLMERCLATDNSCGPDRRFVAALASAVASASSALLRGTKYQHEQVLCRSTAGQQGSWQSRCIEHGSSSNQLVLAAAACVAGQLDNGRLASFAPAGLAATACSAAGQHTVNSGHVPATHGSRASGDGMVRGWNAIAPHLPAP